MTWEENDWCLLILSVHDCSERISSRLWSYSAAEKWTCQWLRWKQTERKGHKVTKPSFHPDTDESNRELSKNKGVFSMCGCMWQNECMTGYPAQQSKATEAPHKTHISTNLLWKSQTLYPPMLTHCHIVTVWQMLCSQSVPVKLPVTIITNHCAFIVLQSLKDQP